MTDTKVTTMLKLQHSFNHKEAAFLASSIYPSLVDGEIKDGNEFPSSFQVVKSIQDARQLGYRRVLLKRRVLVYNARREGEREKREGAGLPVTLA